MTAGTSVSRRRAVRRRRAVALAVLAAIAAFVARSAGSSRPGVLELRSGPATVRLSLAPYVHRGRLDRRGAVAAALGRLPTAVVTAHARIEYAYPRGSAALARLGPGGADVEVPRSAVAAAIDAPVIAQREPNDCEAAALSILLASRGVQVDQLALQAQLPRSGPLDPANGVWGDPDEGFVGRPDGGGPAGGFGVYEGPVARLAARHGVHAGDLTGAAPSAVYARLLAGRAVMAWVGLSDGPYGHWRSPSGHPVSVNFGEHAVVLAGIGADGALSVRNPLAGTSERWSRQQFEQMWARLGRRALAG